MSIDNLFNGLRRSVIGLGLVAVVVGCENKASSLCPEGTKMVEIGDTMYCRPPVSVPTNSKPFTTVTCPQGSLKQSKRTLDGGFSYYCLMDNHIRHGPKVELYKNETVRLNGNYQDDKENGTWTKWYENGVMSERGNYNAGDKVGVWIAWNEQGVKIREGEFYGDKPSGKFTAWYDNGKLHKQGECDKGYKIGDWTIIDENGTVTKQNYPLHKSTSSEECYS